MIRVPFAKHKNEKLGIFQPIVLKDAYCLIASRYGTAPTALSVFWENQNFFGVAGLFQITIMQIGVPNIFTDFIINWLNLWNIIWIIYHSSNGKIFSQPKDI